jgi:hypothetical protein
MRSPQLLPGISLSCARMLASRLHVLPGYYKHKPVQMLLDYNEQFKISDMSTEFGEIVPPLI